MAVCPAILPTAKPFTVAAAVLKQKNPTEAEIGQQSRHVAQLEVSRTRSNIACPRRWKELQDKVRSSVPFILI